MITSFGSSWIKLRFSRLFFLGQLEAATPQAGKKSSGLTIGTRCGLASVPVICLGSRINYVVVCLLNFL